MIAIILGQSAPVKPGEGSNAAAATSGPQQNSEEQARAPDPYQVNLDILGYNYYTVDPSTLINL